MPRKNASCGKSWERRTMSKQPKIRKRVFPASFFMRQTTYPNPVNTDYTAIDTAFFYLVPICQTTFYLPDYTTRAAPKFCHPSKDLEKAAGSRNRPDYLHRRRLRSRSGKSNRRLHKQQRGRADYLFTPSSSSNTLTFPFSSSSNCKQQTTLASNVLNRAP